MSTAFTTGQWFSLHSLVVMAGLAIYITTSRARRQRRHPSAAIAWVVSLALLPYIALPLYLLVGNRKAVRESTAMAAPALPPAGGDAHRPSVRFQRLARAMDLPPVASHAGLHLHHDGRQALERLRLVIFSATQTLDLCTFVFGRDELGDEVASMLIQQARAGVRIRLLIDGIGFYLGGRPRLGAMRAAGIRVALFVSPFSSALPGRTNLRNHRKMALADGRQLWSGGRNLAAEYFLGRRTAQPNTVPWVDLSFDTGGPIARQAQDQFDLDWSFATDQPPAPRLPPPEPRMPDGAPLVQLVPSGPDQADDTVYSLLVSSCFSAQARITAITPYFVPDATLLMALSLAARRGVAVNLILPRHSNHRLADIARRSALRYLAEVGVRLWLTDGMVHAKAIIVDNELALAGSANLDERSMFLNYELMFAFFEHADVQCFADWLEQQRAGAMPYTPTAPGVLREFTEGLVRWLAFQL